MKVGHKIYIVSLLVLLLSSCKKEDQLEPSAEQVFYQLPQGNAAYDATFVDFQKQYGTYFLYRFTDNDFRWSGTGISNALYMAKQADPQYIQAAYDFIDKAFLKAYEPEKLQQLLPYKFLLSAGIHQLTVRATNPTGYDTVAANTELFAGINHVTFGYANNNMLTLSNAKKTELQANLHKTVFTYALNRGKIQIPSAFTSLFLATGNSATAFRGLGFLEFRAGYTAQLDFLMYVYAALRYNEQQFAALYLTPAFDTSGLAARKYAIVKNYLRVDWGIDTQDIANRVW